MLPSALPIELRPNRGDGTRTRNRWVKKEPPPSQQADVGTFKEPTTAEASNGCEARLRTRTSCFRGRRGTSSTTSHLVVLASGRRDSNSQPPAPEAGALPLRHVQVGCCVVLTAGVEPALTAV